MASLHHQRSSIRLLSTLMTWANSLVESAWVYWVCYKRILSVSSIQQVYEVAISTKQNSQHASIHDDAYETLRVDNREDGKNFKDRFNRESIKTLVFCKNCSSIRRGAIALVVKHLKANTYRIVITNFLCFFHVWKEFEVNTIATFRLEYEHDYEYEF